MPHLHLVHSSLIVARRSQLLCTDDPSATVHSSDTCIYAIPGCTNSSSVNFNPVANVDDRSCRSGHLGCIFQEASNFDPSANINDGSCIFAPTGCVDSNALNYNSGFVALPDHMSYDEDIMENSTAFAIIRAINTRRNGHCSSPLLWDQELARSASEYSANCPQILSDGFYRGGYGESLAAGYASAELAVESWYAGATSYPFPSSGEPNLGNAVVWADFTQLVWKSTARVGCSWRSSAECGTNILLCRYAPPGNDVGSFERNVQAEGTCAQFTGCIFPIVGCLSPSASNYDSSATTEIGATCFYDVVGCTDSTALNYQPAATVDSGRCVPDQPDVTGCTDPVAMNYDSAATQLRNGFVAECRYLVRGCTDSNALNYLPDANDDDGSCVAAKPGCLSPEASNFDSTATVNDESCAYVRVGCTDSSALNYNPIATEDDGSCRAEVRGCTAPEALNYDSLATVLAGCRFAIAGCTNPAADNYVSAANVDDGTCAIIGCQDSTALNYRSEATSPGELCWYSEFGCTNSRAINYISVATVEDGTCIIQGCTNPQALNFAAHANANDGSCIDRIFGCFDSAASNFMPAANTANQTLCRFGGCTDSSAFDFDPSADFNDGSCAVMGCTDSRAFNYALDATHDDGSCSILGCTDSTKLRYEAHANVDDGSCVAPVPACLDPDAVNSVPPQFPLVNDPSRCVYPGCLSSQATNYNPTATVEDGSCVFARASATVASFGYLSDCLAFVDANRNAVLESDEPSAVSDAVGYFSVVYQQPGVVTVLPSSLDAQCIDTITASPLFVPMLTDVDARIVSPLTTVAKLLQIRYNETSFGANQLLWQSLSLAPQSVWRFDALFTWLTSLIPYRLRDALWFVRQTQVLNSVTFATGAFLRFETTVAGLAGYEALARMVHDGPVDLKDPGNITQMMRFMAEGLDVDFDAELDLNRVDAIAGQIVQVNQEFEARTVQISTPFRRRQLQQAPPATPEDTRQYICLLAGTLTDAFGLNATGSCTNTTAELGCTLPLASNYNSLATINDASCVVMGCTNATSVNYNSRANEDDGSCVDNRMGCTINFALNYDSYASSADLASCVFAFPGCTDSHALNYLDLANVDDGSCVVRIVGCLVPSASNYNPSATVNGGCIEPPPPPPPAAGCLDELARNFDSSAVVSPPGACAYGLLGCLDSQALNYLLVATEDDGSCVAVVNGCLAPDAANYNSQANRDDGTCSHPGRGCPVPSAVNYDSTASLSDGSCRYAVAGCSDSRSLNFNPEANVAGEDCQVPGCVDSIATNYLADANVDSGVCTFAGCTDSAADNYNSRAVADDGRCVTGGCLDSQSLSFITSATFDDGSCDLRPAGCTDPDASNFAAGLISDPSTCRYAGCTLADGTLNFDSRATFDDGTCRYDTSVRGCTDPFAGNYLSLAVISEDCEYGGCTEPGAPSYNPSATYDDGTCGALVYGCTDSRAENFNAFADADDGSCVFDSQVVNGCTNSLADNYNPSATVIVVSGSASNPDFLCTFGGCTDSIVRNYDPSADFDDGSCDPSRRGCMDSRAENYDLFATLPCVSDGCTPCLLGGCTESANPQYSSFANFDDGTCEYQPRGCTSTLARNYVTGAVLDDGSCSFAGCTDSDAFNFDPSATHDNGACQLKPRGCTSSLADNYRGEALIDDGSCVYLGCRDSAAVNYDSGAQIDSGRCHYPSPPPLLPPNPPSSPPPSPPTPRGSSDGTIASSTLLTSEAGGWPADRLPLTRFEQLGSAVTAIGDVDGDGVPDVAFSSLGPRTQFASGRVYVALLSRTGGLKGLLGVYGAQLSLSRFDYFGSSLASPADLDGDLLPDGDLNFDGFPDLAAGAHGDDGEAGPRTGAVYLLFLAEGGIVMSSLKLSNHSTADVGLPLQPYGEFGRALAVLNDAEGGETVTVAVGAPGEDDDAGAVYLLSLQLTNDQGARNVQGALLSFTRVAPPNVSPGERFGWALAWVPDRDGDGHPELAIGAPGSPAEGRPGSVYLYNHRRRTFGDSILQPGQRRSKAPLFGSSIALGADWDENGERDLLVGAPGEPEGGSVYLIYQRPPGQAVFNELRHYRYTPTSLGLAAKDELVGQSVAALGRIDGDLVPDVVIGTPPLGTFKEGGVVTVLLKATPPNAAPGDPIVAPDRDAGDANLIRAALAEEGMAVWGVATLITLLLAVLCLLYARSRHQARELLPAVRKGLGRAAAYRRHLSSGLAGSVSSAYPRLELDTAATEPRTKPPPGTTVEPIVSPGGLEGGAARGGAVTTPPGDESPAAEPPAAEPPSHPTFGESLVNMVGTSSDSIASGTIDRGGARLERI